MMNQFSCGKSKTKGNIMNKRMAICLLATISLLSLALSGCIKIEMSFSVQADGSSEAATIVGLSSELMEMAPEDENPMLDIEDQIREELGEEVAIEQWSEDGYEWIKVINSFSNLEELNTFMRDESEVENFSLKKETGIFKEHFIFDADFSTVTPATLGQEGGIEEFDVPMDLLDIVDFVLSVSLPGSIVETNGNVDENSGVITWSTSDQNGIQVHAESEIWNIKLIVIIVVIIVLIILAGSIVLLFLRKKRMRVPGEHQGISHRLEETGGQDAELQYKTSKVEAGHPTPASEPIPIAVDPLEEVGARELLEQVNRHLLQGKGKISGGKDAMRIQWTDPRKDHVQRGITIQVQDASTLLINGQPFPATPEGVKTGLATCLKRLQNQ
jgi:hypothetical protein